MIGRTVAKLVLLAWRVWRRGWMVILRPAFRRSGRRFIFDPYGAYSFETIEVGDDVFFGQGAVLVASESFIRIGSNVMLGPNVTVLGGNHRVDVVGVCMSDAKGKRPEDDRGVVILDDVWVGAGATILHGVVVGRGAVVGAGAVVTRDVPAYAIVGGSPASVLRMRFTTEQIRAHERGLGWSVGVCSERVTRNA